jgi:hypothetical protein
MRSFRVLAVAVLGVMLALSSVSFVEGVSQTYELCLIQLGVQQSDGSVSWLPGYAYAPIPPPCPEKFDNYTDVLGRTMVIHQFNETRVYVYKPPSPPPVEPSDN